MKVVIFLPNWLGDLVMATPMLRALRRHFGPETHLVGVMRPFLAEVLSGTPWLDEQWFFNPRAKQPEFRHWNVIQRMRRARFDMALLLPNSFRTAVVARLGGARQRIGYGRYARGPLLTQKLASPRIEGHVADCPMVDYYLAIAEAVGCPPESQRLELTTLAKDEAAADRVWQQLGLRTDGRVTVFNSGSSNGQAKFWPNEHFAALAQRVAAELDHDVLVMCGPKERQLARDIVRLANHPRVFSMAEQPLDLGTAKACIRRSRLMVSTDSGPRHVAAAFGKPVITLFGPTLPVTSDNPTVQAIHLQLDLDCIACQNRVCPLGHHRCMRDLVPDTVFVQVARLVRNVPVVAAA
jgi:heptosyltransferase II